MKTTLFLDFKNFLSYQINTFVNLSKLDYKYLQTKYLVIYAIFYTIRMWSVFNSSKVMKTS